MNMAEKEKNRKEKKGIRIKSNIKSGGLNQLLADKT
jgi:hypothetical protein